MLKFFIVFLLTRMKALHKYLLSLLVVITAFLAVTNICNHTTKEESKVEYLIEKSHSLSFDSTTDAVAIPPCRIFSTTPARLMNNIRRGDIPGRALLSIIRSYKITCELQNCSILKSATNFYFTPAKPSHRLTILCRLII